MHQQKSILWLNREQFIKFVYKQGEENDIPECNQMSTLFHIFVLRGGEGPGLGKKSIKICPLPVKL